MSSSKPHRSACAWQDVEIILKAQPRNFEGFYGAEECDVDGVPLKRDRTKKA